MDSLSKEERFAYVEPSPQPPALSESLLDFGSLLQGSSKTLQQVITNTTTKPMIWLAEASGAAWLILEPDHGVLQPGERQSIRITANARFLTPGGHTVTLTFSSEGDNSSMSSSMTGKVSVAKDENAAQASPTVAPLPLQVGLNFGGLTPDSTKTLMLAINNPDDRQVKWDVQIGVGKSGLGMRKKIEHRISASSVEEAFDINAAHGVTVSASSGLLPPHKSTYIDVTVNTAQLAVGYSYMTDLTLTSSIDGASTSIEVPIDFYVSYVYYDDGGPKPPPFVPPNIIITIEPGQDHGQSALTIPNDNNKRIDWEIVSDAAWLVPDLLSGTIEPRQVASVKLVADRKRLAADYSTDLHLTLNWHPTNGHATALMIPVTVEPL
ncbi:MAG TPA: hypothetical protein VFA09_21985 [Ktedonobacteraceae bacterium]|nr:hypothetical protein [Ktedonobacteraceae bacterium]